MQHSNYDPAQLEVHKQPLNMGHTEFQSQIACPHRKSNHRTYCQKLSFYQESRQSCVLRSSCIVAQSLSHVQLFETHGLQHTRLPVLHHFLELARTHVHWVGDAIQHFIFCRPLLLPSVFPSIRVCSNESALCIRWPKYWSYSFRISPSNEYSGLIFFWMDLNGFNLLVIQGTLKSLLQHRNSKQLH